MPMPIIDFIDCKTKGATAAYPFTPCMTSKSMTKGNMTIFEDLNINQLGCDKGDPHFEKDLTLWWGDLKTEG